MRENLAAATAAGFQCTVSIRTIAGRRSNFLPAMRRMALGALITHTY